MYGHFNQRPPWVKIAGNKAIWNRGAPSDPSVQLPPNYDANPNEDYNYIHWWGTGGNPEIGFEKMIQYEVGFDQDIAGVLGFRCNHVLQGRQGSDKARLPTGT